MTTTPPTHMRESHESPSRATNAAPGASNGRGRASVVPTMAAADKGSPDDIERALRALRAFHVGADAPVSEPADDLLPALLHPYRDAARLRTDYPVFLCVEQGALVCRPLSQQLSMWADAVRAGGRVFADNLVRVERRVRDELGDAPSPRGARDVLASASDAVHRDLGLKSEAGDALRAGLDALVEQVAADGVLLGFGDGAALRLTVACARATVRARRAAFVTSIEQLCHKLRSLIAVERAKDPSSRESDALASSLGGSSLHIDAAALSRVLGPHRGSVKADPARRQRLEFALSGLDAYLGGAATAPIITFVCRHPDRVAAVAAEDVRVVCDTRPCAAAITEFHRAADEMAAVLRAARLARLEIDGAYDPSVHAAWIERLTWDGFSAAELRVVTPVFAMDDPSRLCGDGLGDLSRLLRTGVPVKVLAEVAPAGNPDEDAGVGDSVRFELGYFAISHREALVHQSAEARPGHLVDGLRRAFDATRPSVHVLAAPHEVGGGTPSVGGWLHTGAAVDGRAHPLFCYDPEPGVSWARRFELSGNPDPDADWPVGALPHRDAGGSAATMDLAFTFADFALLEPNYRGLFAVVPAGAADDALTPIAEWLRFELDDAVTKLPFVWAVAADGALHRLVVTRELAFASRDRQRYWRTLQEWAGVHNEHVERAVADALEQAGEAHRAELERFERERAEEVEQVRRSAAGEAMQRLAAALLDADLDAFGGGVPTSAALPARPAAAAMVPSPEPALEADPVPAAPAAPAAPSMSFDEPFIDTALCTSCNDCLNVNSVMFGYDENKQARIEDPRAGTFEHLVIAAEKCPAKCIHPGKPLDPKEPNLEALIARAAPFN